MALLSGRCVEAEKLLKKAEELGEADPACPEQAAQRAWLEGVMPTLRAAASQLQERMDQSQWTTLNLPDIGMDIYLRRGDTIEIRLVVEFPSSFVQAMTMNWEADLSSSWLPFHPSVDTKTSELSSSVMMYVKAKLPVVPGYREVYVYRHILDCFGPENLIEDGRQGLLVVEYSPENWRTGGVFLGEFNIAPPSTSRRMTRDEQQLSLTFYEPLSDKSVRCTSHYRIVLNVPRWLLPDAAIQWLAKHIGRQWHAGVVKVISNFEKYGYVSRAASSTHPLYAAVKEHYERLYPAPKEEQASEKADS